MKMMDCAGETNEEFASYFIVSTCQLLQKLRSYGPDRMHNLTHSTDALDKEYSILCGSYAEFYIRPLHSCIDDVDTLIAKTDELVFTGDFPVLPSDVSGLSDTIKCFNIVPYHKHPSFVRLRVMGKMRYDWKCKRYDFKQTSHSCYMSMYHNNHEISKFSQRTRDSNRCFRSSVVCGPALKSRSDSDVRIGTDSVKTLFCPQWPREARNWPTRPRKCGWPLISTISEVVQNGFHVVYVQHRSCRDDKGQWRLSFSLAELILLQSWTQIQQIVYNLLRFFAKRELIEKDCPKEDEVLCPYHLKTLMLWTCEEMPKEWWNSFSVISICCKLLRKLSEWLNRKYYPNYFIPEANLFYEPKNSRILVKTERILNDFQIPGILCHWFVKNYILPVTRTHFRFFNSGNVTPHFIDYLMPLLEYRMATESDSLNLLITYKFLDSYQCCRNAIKHGLSSGLRHNINLRRHMPFHSRFPGTVLCLPTTEKLLCFAYFDNLLYILHTAYGLRYGEISWDGSLFVECIEAVSMQHKIIRSQYHNFPKTYVRESSRFNYMRAQNLMHSLTGSNSLPEFQLLSFMSKSFLRKALEFDDSQFNGIASAAFAYLAALHFATSEKREAIRFCLEVLDQISGKDDETLNAGCLLFIDDVARIVGFILLHKKIVENNLRYIDRRLYLDLRISPKVFAHYLVAFSDVIISKPLPYSTYPMDKYVKALIKTYYDVSYYNPARDIVYRRTVSEIYAVDPLLSKEIVIDLLMEYALENMILFYNFIGKDIGIQSKTADCFLALNLYKSCHFDKMFNLCERILHEPELISDLKEFALTNVLLMSPLDSYFDRDVQSLLGFHALLYYLSPLKGVGRLVNAEFIAVSTFAQCFARSACFQRTELSEYLANPLIDVKCYYCLGRHFLARYLKVRCCIDCNLPYTKAMTEFAAQKVNLPFEHIIRTFLLRKLSLKTLGADLIH